MKQFCIWGVACFLSNIGYAQTVNTYISKGNEYYLHTQFELAEAEYRKALQSEPKNTTAQYNLANALHKQKKYEEAIGELEKLSATTKDATLKSASFYNEGVAYTKEKNLEASIEAYKKALRLTPGDEQARENLQKALSELKKKQADQQNQQKKQQSGMSKKEAEQKLKLLQEKEKQLQQRLQNQKQQKGGGQSKNW